MVLTSQLSVRLSLSWMALHSGKDVDAVALVELAFLVALAFEQPPDGDFLVEQGGQQPFQYGKVRFIPKEAFHRPVETDVIGHGFQCYILQRNGLILN